MTTIDASRQLICLGPRLESDLRLSRRLLLEQERVLAAVRREYARLAAELEDFFDGEYWPKVGRYLRLADRLWSRVLGGPRVRRRPRTRTEPAQPAAAEPESSRDLKGIYRELARRYHPDRAPEADREFFAARMAAVNQAFDRCDARELDHFMLLSAAEVGGGPEDALRRLAFLKEEGRSIRSFTLLYRGRIGASRTGAIYRLMSDVRKRAAKGGDLLAEMGQGQKSRAKRYRDLLRRMRG